MKHLVPTLRRSLRQSGISLLEVLAALVILSLGATVAFTWFGQSVSAMSRLKDEEASLLARNSAMDYLRAINPTVQPEGMVEMPGYQLKWRSRPIRDTVHALTSLGTRSRYDVSLYELQVDLVRDGAAGTPWVSFKLELAGFEQVSGSSMGIFGAGNRDSSQ